MAAETVGRGQIGPVARMLAWVVVVVGLMGAGCASVDPALPVARQGTPGRGIYEPLPTGSFQQVTAPAAGPVVLLFQSPRCPYCRAVMKSVRAGVAQKGKPWKVYTVDVAQEPALRAQLGVGPVPCLVYFRDGQEVERSTGWRPSMVLNSTLDSFFRQSAWARALQPRPMALKTGCGGVAPG